MQPAPHQPAFRIGPYILDLRAGELRKGGARIRLQEQSLRVLAALAEQQGQVVTREELKKRLWPHDTFVDFETGLNSAVSRLRDALCDDAEKPRYIETLPRRGYRILIPVEVVTAPSDGVAALAAPAPAADPRASAPPYAPTRPALHESSAVPVRLWASIAAAVVALAGAGYWLTHGRPAFSFRSRDSVLVADFENQTGDPRFDNALSTAFVVSMEQSRYANVFPRTRLDGVLARMERPPGARITPALGREICQRENIRGLIVCSITRTGQEYALTAQLIDPQSGETVRSYTERSYGEDNVLEALELLSKEIREALGESLYQIHAANKSLPQVTTRSLSALKQYADGKSLWHRGKFDEAMMLYRAAVETDPDFAMAHAGLGNGYYSYVYYQPDKGKTEYEKALSVASRTTDRERLSIQANFEVNQEHVDEAATIFKSYLQRYPDDWSAHLNYARILRLHNREPEAIEQYEQILRIAPDDAKTYIELATTYKGLGQFQKAVDAYSQAFRLEPGWVTSGNINREYGFTLVAMGQDDKARQAFTAMLAKPDTRAEGLRSLALLDLYHGRFAAARQRLEQELKMQEVRGGAFDKARVHFQLAVIAKGEGDSRGQMEHLDASVADLKDIGPKVTWAALVGQEYARADATGKAENLVQTVAGSVDPRNSEDGAFFHILQAEVALAKGDANAAIKALLALESETSANIRSIRPEALAHAYQQSGNTDRAIACYEKLLAIPEGGASSWEPQQHWLAAYVTLASDYAAKGEKEKARDTLAAFLQRWKDADPNLPLLKKALQLQARISP